MQQSHTYHTRTSQHTDQKCGKSATALALNLIDTQLDEGEHRSDNMRMASCGLKWLNSSSVFQLEFCVRLTALCSET